MNNESFVPVIRFMVVSDVHISDEPSVERERFDKAIKTAYRIAHSSEAYKKLDAIAVVGDFATNGSLIQMEVAKKIMDENVDKNETELILSIASHEYHTEGGPEVATARFMDVFGEKTDKHAVINGFHFVSISPTRGCNYDDNKRKWMKENLVEAAKDGSEKPIFVFQHPHNTGTVYGSILWGETDLIGTYMDFPQIIHFSGHSHAPINDPRSIHQQHFTSLGTGTLSYFELDEFDKLYGTYPENREDAAQMLIVEADADNRVRVYPYDVLTDNYFPYVWKIDTPSDPSTFKYTNKRYTNAASPYFENGTEILINEVNSNSVEIEFAQAKVEDDPYVNSYDITVKDSNGFTARKVSVWSGYYFYNMPETIKVKVDGLEANSEYTIEVTANSFWYTSSKDKLTATVHTK